MYKLMLIILIILIIYSANSTSTSRSMRFELIQKSQYFNFSNPEIIGGKSHECYRKCKGNDGKICSYTFLLSDYTSMSLACRNCPRKFEDCFLDACVTGGGNIRPITVVNHMLPGPSIQVCEADTIIRVNVINSFSSDSATIHWHGMHQMNTPFMDGTPYVTQCPILPRNEFLYEFNASQVGTHMWHSHVGFQEADGVYGSLIVKRADDHLEMYYDFDLPEHVMIIWHWFDTWTAFRLSTALHRSESIYGYGLTINGYASHVKFENGNDTYETPKKVFHVDSGKRYRFRVISNGALYCPVQVSVDDHRLLMIASETGVFSPVEVDTFIINAGERYDFVLTTDKKPGNYWIRYRALGHCNSGNVKVSETAILHYNDVPEARPEGSIRYEDSYRSGELLNPVEILTENYENNSLIKLVDLNNSAAVPRNLSRNPDHTFYFDFSSNLYKSYFVPGPYPQINNISFEFPQIPLLSQHQDLLDSMYCTEDSRKNQECISGFCTCPTIYRVKQDSLVEIIFVDTTVRRNQDHPMHLHGHDFYVLAMESIGEGISAKDVKRLNKFGKIKKNFKTPIVKDTINVPAKGYTILRFFATNPGYWIFHCHISNHMEMGMAFVVKVGEHSSMPVAPVNFPKCGNYV